MSTERLDDMVPIGEAREWVRQHRREGVDCPCCTQYAKLYPRVITGKMARGLIAAYRFFASSSEAWLCLVEIFPNVRDNTQFCLLRNWALIEPRPGQRADGSRRTGWWRLTEAGRDFVLGRRTVAKYAMVYNGITEYYSGPQVSITDRLGKGFDYRKMMGTSA